MRRSRGGRACVATHGRTSDQYAEPQQQHELRHLSVHAREEDGDEDDRPELAGHSGPQHCATEWGRKHARIREDRDECAERRRREGDAEQPPLGVHADLLEGETDCQTDRERHAPADRAAAENGARHVMLDHLQPGEEEEEREPEVGEKVDVGIELGEPEHLGADQDPEHDLDDDRRQHEPQVPPREHGAERRREEHEHERLRLFPRELGGE